MDIQTSLQVSQSLNNARWLFPESDHNEIQRIMRMHKLPEFIARLLVNRGIEAKHVPSFLFPSLKTDFPDPNSLVNMRQMAEFVAESLLNDKKFAILGDFDVDGATSTAILTRFLREIGHYVPFYIPDRLNEGYGPNADALARLKNAGADIVFLVDCGTTSHSVVAAGREMGLDIIILDHHEAEDTLPPANFVINPKQKDDASGLGMLAAVGVVFLVCVSINTVLRERGYYEKSGVIEPSLKKYLELVALGTVCDMVPLTGPNRLFVRRGFEQMSETTNEGLKSLIEVSKMSGDPSPYHAGFVFGPRINAGSRVHQSDLGAKLLSTDSSEEALNIAWTLEDCNEKRKSIQKEMVARARTQVMARKLEESPAIIVDDPHGHPGLAGLVAGQLAKEFGKPACVITYAQNHGFSAEGRGSGRSIKGVNLASIFIAARQEGLLIKGGGHAMAGGFTIDPDKIDEFTAFTKNQVQKQLDGEAPVAEVDVDGLISVRGIKTDFIKLLERNAGPFGQGNPEPVFVLPKVRVERPDIVGKDHVRCFLVDWEGGTRIKAVAFRAAETQLGQALLRNDGKAMHLAGQFKLDTWGGNERVELHILDAVYEEDVLKESSEDVFDQAALIN